LSPSDVNACRAGGNNRARHEAARRLALSNALTVLLLAALQFVACAGLGRVTAVPAGRTATVLTDVSLDLPVADICRDSSGVALLEAGGARIVRLDSRLVPFDTIPMTKRLAGVRGCAADPYYYYVYDDRNLYRMARVTETLAVWLGNVRPAGIASFATGEALISDELHGLVFYKTLFGSSRRFLTAADLPQPGALAATASGQFCALSGSRTLVFFNRTGVIARRINLPSPCDLLAADDSTVYLAQRGVPVILTFARERLESWSLPSSTSPGRLVALDDRLVVLDSGKRLLAVDCR